MDINSRSTLLSCNRLLDIRRSLTLTRSSTYFSLKEYTQHIINITDELQGHFCYLDELKLRPQRHGCTHRTSRLSALAHEQMHQHLVQTTLLHDSNSRACEQIVQTPLTISLKPPFNLHDFLTYKSKAGRLRHNIKLHKRKPNINS